VNLLVDRKLVRKLGKQMRHSNQRATLILSGLLLSLVLSPLAALAQSSGGNYKITSSVQAGGGGTSVGSGNKVIEGTAGQAAAGGPQSNSSLSHTGGFWPTTLAVALPTPPQGGPGTMQFSASNYSVPEDLGALTITVTRSGDTSGSASVVYATSDGTAQQKSDYEIAVGTINFAPGETTRTFPVLINEDIYSEGLETFTVVLSNPIGASLGLFSTTTVAVTDDSPEASKDPIDDPQSFVYMHYHDFLNREPDAAGLQFWTNEITSCGQDAACIAAKRTNVSAAFFLSVEFQQTGYLLYLFQKESFASLPRYQSYMRDLQQVSQGLVVKAPGWQQKLASNQQQLAETWVNRPQFKATYDGMSNTAYVNALYANAGIVPPAAERDALVTALDTASQTRAAVLMEVANNSAFRQQEQNPAFVLMQYFGYLRRDPDSAPDSDLSGYYFWLNKLNQFNGDFQQAEMVKSFLVSGEYRARFGPQ